MNIPTYDFYNIVETQSIGNMLFDGKAIDLAIPRLDNQSQYLLVEELNLDKSNLFLQGGIVGDSSSLVTIRSEKDMLYGTIRKGNQSFTITGIKPGVSVISRNKLRTNTSYCPLDATVFTSARDSTFVSPYDFRTNVERFEILSASGDQVMLNRQPGKKGHQVTIHVAAYRPGLYLIRGYAPDGVVTTKFVKQ